MNVIEWLLGRANQIDSSQHSVSLCDLGRPDAPLIYVNRGFENLTGYSRAEVVGRNCRFLQGADTDRGTVRRLREAVTRGEPLLVDLLNYRKDGSRFWNRLSLRPVRTAEGALTHIIGIQSDMTRLKDIEEQLNTLALELGKAASGARA
jgi:PAS domain S-box-containing protein